MPNIQEVEQFKNILNELGEEPEILAERDEEIEDILPPEQGLPEGLSDLLETPEGEAAGPAVEGAAAERAVEGAAAEPGAGEEPAVPSGETEMPFQAAPPEKEVDLSDLFGDQDLSDLDVLEGLQLPEGEAQAPSTEAAEPPAEFPAEEFPGAPPEAEVPPEAPEVPEEFAEAPGEAAEIPDEFAGAFEAEPAEPGEAAEVPGEAAAGEFSLEDFEFELPEEAGGEGQEPGFETAEEPAPAGAEPAVPEDEFAIPEGLFDTEAAEEAAEEQAPMPEGEFELPEEFSLPEEGFAEQAAGEAGEAAEEPAGEASFEFELPEEAAPETGEGISAEELPEMPGFDIEGFDAEAFAAPEGEETAGEEAFDLSDFQMPVEEAVEEGVEQTEEAAAGPAAPQAPPAPEVPPAFEVPAEEEAAAPAPEEEAPGGMEFELPEEFTLPEGGFEEQAGEETPAEEFALEEEAPVEPSEEETEFLKVLEEQILPGGEPGAEPAAPSAEEAGQAGEAAEALPAEEAFAEFAEIPLEEAGPGEAFPEAAAEAPGAQEIPEEVSLEEEIIIPEGEHIDLEAPSEIPEGVEEYDLDEFSLEGLGEAFGVEEETPPPGPPEEQIPAEVPVVEEQFPEEIAVPGTGEITFTDKQFAAIKRGLSRLPRNLKIAVEQLIAEKGLEGEELRSLLALLIDGAAPAAVAAQVSRLTGQRIVLPKVFERLTGVAFEEKRRTFAYAFRENILPILRVVLLSLFVLGVLAFLGHHYVYRPLYANYLYRQGYGQIDKERYQMANDSFDRAASVWVFKSWFFRYARGFTGKQQFQLAAEKYEQLLRRFPRDREGKLGYASLLTFHLAGYEKADKLLQDVLEENMKDYEALLAQGDNYLEWAQEDKSRYEDARFAYASIIDYYGEKDEVLMRMLRYFIRTDKFDETRTLKAYLDEKHSVRVDPELYASVYAELAGYWIDKGNYDSVPDMLFKAMDRMMNQPDIHYQLARYYRYVQDPVEEETALKAAITLLERMQPLDKKHLFMLIDSYNRRGETFWRREEYLDAEVYFQKAIARIEDAQARRIFGQREEFGLAYKNYGDLYYYVSRDLEPALDLYLKALNNRYETPDLNYKIGYIHYAADRYEDALLAFSKVVDQRPSNVNALYGLANSLYQRGYYSAAQGYYLRLLNLLEGREERIPYLQIYENPEHSALVEYIMKVYNNLGVTLKQLADRSLDPEKESKALVNLTFSSERFDLLSRDPVTVERGLTKNLAYLNQGGILYPTSEFELQIYTRLPIDLQANRF